MINLYKKPVVAKLGKMTNDWFAILYDKRVYIVRIDESLDITNLPVRLSEADKEKLFNFFAGEQDNEQTLVTR